MKNIPSFVRFAFALAMASGMSALPAVEIVAHRGASYDAPENTVASQELAWKHGADAAEFDVRRTKDGQLAIMHDATTKRTAGRDAKFAELTLAELRQLDAGTWKDAKFAGEKVPTLDEMLQHIAPGKRVVIHIYVGADSVPDLVAAIKRNKITPQQAAIISFDHAPLLAVKKALPSYQALWLANAPSSDPKKKKSPTLDELIRDCRAAGFDGLSFNQNWPLEPDGVKKIKAAGLLMHVWTVDLPQIAQRWIDLGVDSITTNRAGWLREQLKK
ncbi:MAG: glycerophosphodiester phosphodiesterase [Opitutaceae bacterium]